MDTGCCGMAGAFGALDSKYDLSLKVAAPLVQSRAQPAGTHRRFGHELPASNRAPHARAPKHMAELLADAIIETSPLPRR